MKELLREERLKYLKQKREQEQIKRKEELEENLKRKQELREKQLKERQKKIEELKLLEAEKRAAVFERKKLKEESIQVPSILDSFFYFLNKYFIFKARFADLIKREQERETQRSQTKTEQKITKNKIGGDLLLSNNNGNMVTSLIVDSSNDNKLTLINKSLSAFNLNLTSNKKYVLKSD